MPWDGTELRVGELGSGAAAGTVGTVASNVISVAVTLSGPRSGSG